MDNTIEYDYTNQAWIINGKYIRCHHDHHTINEGVCYGTLHEGETPSLDAEVH